MEKDIPCYACIKYTDLYIEAQKQNVACRKKMSKEKLYDTIYGNKKLCFEHYGNKNEQWKTVEKAARYEISNCGRLRNVNTLHIHKGAIDVSHYLRYTIVYDNGEKKPTLAHRLVAKMFMENKNNYPYD